MPRFMWSRQISFQHAFHGLAYVIRTQKNAWIHAAATVVVVLLAVYLGLSVFEWALLTLTIGVVWLAECLNTAIETAVDLVTAEFHPLAKISKDVAAAGVLIAAISSIIVGVLLLGPPLYLKLQSLFFR